MATNEGRPVILTIRGTQWEGTGSPDSMELMTEGSLFRKDDVWFLRYKESEATGLEGTTTTIRVDDPRTVSVIRTGATHMRMTFVEGLRHVTRMDLPFGTIDVDIFTNAVQAGLSDSGGEVHLGYSVEMNSREPTNSRLDVTFRHAGGAVRSLEA
jgi:uncharacterized beta-barrel protein YwiB (DUF1934 family)